MRIQKMRVVTGTMLGLVLSAVSVSPVMAHPTGESELGQLISQTSTPTDPSTTPSTTPATTPSTDSQSSPKTEVEGTVRRVNGDMVTLETPDGQTREIKMKESAINNLGLEPGKQVLVTLDDQGMASDVALIFGSPSNAAAATTTESTQDSTERNTRREEQVIQQRTTVETRPAAPAAESPSAAPRPQQQPAETGNEPVRALW